EESVGTDGRGLRRVQHLERDRAVVPEVACEIYGGHAPPAEFALDRVAIRQPALELLTQVGHSGHSRAVRELLKPWILPQRIESRVDAEPAGRQVERHREQRLQQIQRLFVLTREDVDPDELELIVRTAVRILLDRRQ